ncbi:MAG: tyrosine-type recombinase/integrase [Deinococcales bacterium]
MSDLQRYQGDALSRAEGWASLPADELRRRAARAANARDRAELWALTEAYLFLHGSKGARASRHTLRTYRRGLEDLLDHWQDENLLRPSRDAGVLYIRRLESTPQDDTGVRPQPSTLQVKLAAARTLYRALRWAGATEARPFENVRVAKDPTPPWEKRRPYGDREVERLLELAEPAERVVVLLGAHAGLRISEMTGLRWGDLDLARGELLVAAGKGGKSARVRMTRRLREAVEALRADGAAAHRQRDAAYVLPWGTDHTRKRFRRLCARAGVDYASAGVHGLRHGAGTRYYRQTHDLGRVAAHLRHADIQTTRIYAKIDQDAIGEDIDDW